jgi:histidyl-tRNA synthetase
MNYKMAKPSLPKGTRDFLPHEVLKRNYIFDIVKEVFQKYGFLPIETPSMESLDTLLGKYGEEGDKLLFKVLNNGDFLKDADKAAYEKGNSLSFANSISKRGLRYDLTVPFARFVVMHQSDIQLPFKRYQIQPVWRADRPQKGRYQEFYQCDVDVVGSNSLIYEAELISIYHEIFKKLGIKVNILINNRKILFGMAESAGIPDKFMDMTIAIDKLDKIGKQGVIDEMVKKNITLTQAESILQMLEVKNVSELKPYFNNSEEGLKGIAEVEIVYNYLSGSHVDDLMFDISLARGLNYYTGCIFEVKVDTSIHTEVSMGSIGGGGRYDNLTGSFGLNDVSGVGVSLGAERIYDVMEELKLFPVALGQFVKVIFLPLDDLALNRAFQYAQKLRNNNISCDIYPEAKAMKKQMRYAHERGFEFVAIIGESEYQNNTLTLKRMSDGNQQTFSIDELIIYINS